MHVFLFGMYLYMYACMHGSMYRLYVLRKYDA